MREEEGNWFSRWEDDLPSPDDLIPLSQTLISPDLALAFDIPTPNSHPSPPSASHFDSLDLSTATTTNNANNANNNNNSSDEPARTLKRPRLVWTPQLHKRFVDAVAHLGIKNAVPKTIMQLMSVDGLTRENVASHLQKYRLYLKRMQGLSSSSSSPADAATDQLFASAPIPQHFLRGGGGGGVPDPAFMPFVPVAALQQHQQMVAAAAAAQQQFQQRQIGHFGFGDTFLNRAMPQPGMHRMPPPVQTDDLDEGSRGSGRRVLTLFPTGDD